MSNGTLCVLRDEQNHTWSVWMCRGLGKRERLAGFEDRAAAADYALREAALRNEADSVELTVHLPDDCPCYPEHERLCNERLRLEKR